MIAANATDPPIGGELGEAKPVCRQAGTYEQNYGGSPSLAGQAIRPLK